MSLFNFNNKCVSAQSINPYSLTHVLTNFYPVLNKRCIKMKILCLLAFLDYNRLQSENNTLLFKGSDKNIGYINESLNCGSIWGISNQAETCQYSKAKAIGEIFQCSKCLVSGTSCFIRLYTTKSLKKGILGHHPFFSKLWFRYGRFGLIQWGPMNYLNQRSL